MAEIVKNLKCRNGHEVEVHYEERQQGKHWLCPDCLADPTVDNEQALVAFRGAK